jgi:hypothetical protein
VSAVFGVLFQRLSNVACVALASRNARIVWALLAHRRDYEPKYGQGQHLSAALAA